MADWADILVICGPTATGKTAASVAVAKQLGGEVVSADSMQLYKGLAVGTAQPTEEERQGVPHHLMGVLPPEQRYSVAEYVRDAGACIADIVARGRVPIVVGGTGLYISSLVNGISFTEEKRNPAVRQRLEEALAREGIQPLYEKLCRLDPAYAEKVHPNNHGRVLRALELYEQTGRTMTQQAAASRPARRPYHALILGLTTADRSQLYARIDTRVDRMMEAGILQEARLVYENRGRYGTAAQAIGYKEFFPYFEACRQGKAAEDLLASCVDALKRASRQYAKRQFTWFNRVEGLCWLDASAQDLPAQILTRWAAHVSAAGQNQETREG